MLHRETLPPAANAAVVTVSEAAQSGADAGAVRPSAVEKELARLWAAELGVESINVDDDFFDLGGTSLKLVHAFGHANEHFGTSVAVDVIAEGATIASVAVFFERALSQQ